MSNNQFIDTEIIDKSELIYILSVLLKVPESRIFNLITKLDQNSFLYKKIGKFIKIIGDKKIRELHEVGRNAVIKEEQTEYDRKITSMTCSFSLEIKNFLKEENFSLPATTIRNIDAFLYLINSNYYEKIKNSNKNIRREFLIEQLLFLITYYLKENGTLNFNEIEVKEILDFCIFIPEEVKNKILVEFAKAKTKNGKEISYKIIRKDINGGEDCYLDAYAKANSNRIIEWKYDSEYNYITLIEALEASEDFQELGIGSAKDLCWDLPFIQAMNIFIHDNYQDELLRIDEEYSNFALISQFLLYTMAYAVEEEITEVTSDVVLASFAEWPLLPFNLKLKIIDALFEKEQLTYLEHPFRDKEPVHKSQQKKIIPFKVKENSSNNL